MKHARARSLTNTFSLAYIPSKAGSWSWQNKRCRWAAKLRRRSALLCCFRRCRRNQPAMSQSHFSCAMACFSSAWPDSVSREGRDVPICSISLYISLCICTDRCECCHGEVEAHDVHVRHRNLFTWLVAVWMLQMFVCVRAWVMQKYESESVLVLVNVCSAYVWCLCMYSNVIHLTMLTTAVVYTTAWSNLWYITQRDTNNHQALWSILAHTKLTKPDSFYVAEPLLHQVFTYICKRVQKKRYTYVMSYLYV